MAQRLNSIYRPLTKAQREIRLVHLVPQSKNAANSETQTLIHCSLSHASLDGRSKPIYTALSYTWGDPTCTKPIVIEGSVVHVTQTLETALRHLQHDSVPLWIDAICIDQTNVVEKGEQVHMMREIYENANQTIAWLGPAEEQSDEVIDFLGGFGEESHRLRIFDLDLLNQAHWSRDEKGKEKLVLPKGPLEDLVLKVRQVFNRDRGLKQLTSRPWWSRIWVKQELYVSTDVSFACGMRRISYDHLSSALMLLNICMAVTKFDDMDPDVVLKLDVTTITSSPEAIRMLGGRRSFQKDGRVPLAQLLISSSVVEDSRLRTYAADGRDRIYSILGLSTNAEELGITTDYSKSCREVYIDVANALLRHGDLEILTMCRSRGEVSGLPSWVPDWTAPILVPWMGMPRDKLFAASGDSQHSFIPSTRRDTVTLKGVRVDTIVDCGNPRIGEPHTIRENFTVENLLKEFNELERFVLRGSTIASENRANAVWRIPIADREVSRSGSQSHRATAISESMYRRMRKVAGIPIDHDDGNDGGGNGVDRGWGGYLLRMNEIHNRRPFLSEKGYVGLAPANAAVGDLICILYGAPVPFVLRKKVEEDHQLIGEAYVYGIMDGEFLEQGDAVSEEFVLH